MKSGKYRSIREVTRNEMYCIAKEYANTPGERNGQFFSEKYNLSESTFYAILHKAVLESIVSIEIARNIQRKSADNSYMHGGKSGQKRTFYMYERLINKRKICRLRKEEAKRLIRSYLLSELSLKAFADAYFVNELLFKRALADAVVYSWINDKEVEILKEKTRKQKGDSIEEGFAKLMQKRLYYKVTK